MAIAMTATVMAAATLSWATPAAADPVADFYKGKQIRLILGFDTGGGDDAYGRLLAQGTAEAVVAQVGLSTWSVTGEDLIRLGVTSGPEVGATLRRLLDFVLDDPARYQRELLLRRVTVDVDPGRE